jgi:hypothetical protein
MSKVVRLNSRLRIVAEGTQPATISDMERENDKVLERRRARRFQVEWDVVVRGKDLVGDPFDDAGSLVNLSSRGALVFLRRNLGLGSKVDLEIKLPFDGERSMRYSAEIVRVEASSPNAGIAMRFGRVRPRFSK